MTDPREFRPLTLADVQEAFARYETEIPMPTVMVCSEAERRLRLAVGMRRDLCDECFLDVKLLGSKIIMNCVGCQRKQAR